MEKIELVVFGESKRGTQSIGFIEHIKTLVWVKQGTANEESTGDTL